MAKKNENMFAWNETIQKMQQPKTQKYNAEGIKLEVEATVTYTVTLTKEDMEVIRKYIEENCDKNMLSIFPKNGLLDAIDTLVSDCKIGLYEDDKAVESDFYTSDIQLSHYEERDPEEILMELGFDVGIE